MRASSIALPALVTALLLSTALPSRAQIHTQPQDNVRLNLAMEEWVKAETARVIIVIDTAGQTGGLERAELLKAAEAVADRVEWRVVAMNKVSDSAGLDRWRTILETRLPESRLAALAERAKKASKPGLQVRVGGVWFQPSLPELEKARGALRVKLYARIKEEIALLQQAFPDRQYRLTDLGFNEDARGLVEEEAQAPLPFIPPAAMQVDALRTEIIEETAPGLGAGNSAGGGREGKLRMIALVVLAAFASPPP